MQATHIQTSNKPEHAAVFAGLSLAVGLTMGFAILLGMIGGIFHDWRSQVAMLICASIPVCTAATGMAIISLVWRKENKHLGQAALWLNGMLSFFGFPLMIYWLIAV